MLKDVFVISIYCGVIVALSHTFREQKVQFTESNMIKLGHIVSHSHFFFQ